MIKFNFSLLAVFLFAPQPTVLAQSNSPGCQAKLYSLSVIEAKLPSLEASDLIDNNVEQVGSYVEQFTSQDALAGKPPYKMSATRNVERYWQMRVNSSDIVSLSADKVRYRVINNNTSGNPFSKANIKYYGDIKQYSSCVDGTVVIEGGFSIEFMDLPQLLPGNFRAQIEVCVPINGTQCL